MSKYMLSVSFCIVLSACADQNSPQDTCHDLRDHVVALRMRTVFSLPAERERARQTMERVLGDKFIASCVRDLTPDQRACQLAAPSLRDAEACVPRHARARYI